MSLYLMVINESEASYASAGEADFNAVMAMHEAFGASVKAAGASVVSGEALQPTATATYLRGTRTDGVHAVDNPAPELKEVLGGYYLVDAPSDEVALELAKLCPAPYGHIELRPIWDFSAGGAETAGQ